MKEIKAFEMRKLTISNLILIMNSDLYEKSTRNNAEIELYRRFKNVKGTLSYLISKESKIIEQRGKESNNYLFGDNPTLQMLIELFYKNFVEQQDILLFSEYHLCNVFDSLEPFFKRIIIEEQDNIRNRYLKSDEVEKQLINQAWFMYLEKLRIAINNKNKNDAYEYLQKLIDIEYIYHSNSSLEEQYLDELYFLKALKANFVKDAIEPFIGLSWLKKKYGMIKVLEDSWRLNEQKRILKKQVHAGINVNYAQIFQK
ncbi:MAG: hypothetical protein E7172_00925 [Firmicutes bacterium]|nr:hypothetical protein [Bacillota bacterium]